MDVEIKLHKKSWDELSETLCETLTKLYCTEQQNKQLRELLQDVIDEGIVEDCDWCGYRNNMVPCPRDEATGKCKWNWMHINRAKELGVDV